MSGSAFLRLPLLTSGHARWQWSLDLPRNDQVVSDPVLGLRLEGWILPPSGGATADAPVRLRLRRGGDARTRHELTLNVERHDVIAKVLKEKPTGHPQLRCGFLAHVPLGEGTWDLGCARGDEEMWLSRWVIGAAARAPQRHVLRGNDGWLFLDNDANRSVDQFTGRLLLDAAGLAQWRRYLDGAAALAAALGTRHALLIAPAKEQVLPRLYPHPRAALTVPDQVLQLARPEHRVINGAAVLAAQPAPQRYFMRTDTHWSDRGALQAVLAGVATLGHDVGLARQRFADDRYQVIDNAGDLGIKFEPPLRAATEFLVGHSPYAGASFDNRLPNFGRVMIFHQDDAPFDAKLLMFGASSGYPMLKYLRRLFRRCVFVHSAGHVDVAVARHEQPQALLLQSNGRFLIEPPRLDFDLRAQVAAKRAEGGEAQRLHWRSLAAREPDAAADQMYVDMLREAGS